MLTRLDLRKRLWDHLDGLITLEDLSAWAEQVFRDAEFEPEHADQIAEVLSLIRDATDPHRFRWEEPDFEELVRNLGV